METEMQQKAKTSDVEIIRHQLQNSYADNTSIREGPTKEICRGLGTVKSDIASLKKKVLEKNI